MKGLVFDVILLSELNNWCAWRYIFRAVFDQKLQIFREFTAPLFRYRMQDIQTIKLGQVTLAVEICSQYHQVVCFR